MKESELLKWRSNLLFSTYIDPSVSGWDQDPENRRDLRTGHLDKRKRLSRIRKEPYVFIGD